jgi:protocatechuate 3,4-dioxygenase beta subunit
LVGAVHWSALLALGCGGAGEDESAGGAGGEPHPETGGTGGGGGFGSGGVNGGAARDGGPLCEATRADIEGPFFTPSSPERTDLRVPELGGRLLVVRGQVKDEHCVPVRNAILDFWQADEAGEYDNVGFGLRGHQSVDAEGRYELRTIVPGRYLNGAQYRPAHIHVKVYVGEREALTTQLYFEGDPHNEADPWFSEATMLRPVEQMGELVADFDFSVA